MSDFKKMAGLVLAGGGSRRMGRNKAELEHNGLSFLELSVAHLAAAGCKPVYINNADNLPDILPDLGPLGGIYSAIHTHPEIDIWLITPVDMPLLTHKVLAAMCHGLGDANIARFDGEIFPLLLKLNPKIRAKLAHLMQDPKRSYSMRAFIDEFEPVILPIAPTDKAAFTNVNSPQDYEAICI